MEVMTLLCFSYTHDDRANKICKHFVKKASLQSRAFQAPYDSVKFILFYCYGVTNLAKNFSFQMDVLWTPSSFVVFVRQTSH